MTENKKDVFIEQSPKVAVQIAAAVADHVGPLTLIINMPMNATVGVKDKLMLENPFAIDILRLLETFPEPRLENLTNHIYHKAEEQFGSKNVAAAWLGVNPRTLYRHALPVKKEEDGRTGRVDRNERCLEMAEDLKADVV